MKDLYELVAEGAVSDSCVVRNVPIADAAAMAKEINSWKPSNLRLKAAYRGPRNASVGDTRKTMLRQSSCLKRNAKTVTFYLYAK